VQSNGISNGDVRFLSQKKGSRPSIKKRNHFIFKNFEIAEELGELSFCKQEFLLSRLGTAFHECMKNNESSRFYQFSTIENVFEKVQIEFF
jgi:hypothetical protein